MLYFIMFLTTELQKQHINISIILRMFAYWQNVPHAKNDIWLFSLYLNNYISTTYGIDRSDCFCFNNGQITT